MACHHRGMRLTDRKRQAVLEAAASEFHRDGFDGASMDRIAATAEVSKRTVYNHFPSKEDLFHAIVADLVERPTKLKSITYDSSRPLEEQLLDIGREFADMIMSEDFVTLARVVVSRFIQCPEVAGTIAVGEKSKEALAKWIKVAKKDGRLTVGSPIQAAREFTGVIQEFALWPQVVGSKDSLTARERNRVVASATKMFLALYATPEVEQKTCWS